MNKKEVLINRLIALEITVNKRAFSMLNIYGPYNDKRFSDARKVYKIKKIMKNIL